MWFKSLNYKLLGRIIEGLYPKIYWTPCVVHTLSLALKNICAAKNTENTSEVYNECHWITGVYGDAMHIKNFIINHTMRLSMYKRFSSLKLLLVADTRFASTIVMLKRFKLIRRALKAMVMSEEWASYREDDQEKARFVRIRGELQMLNVGGPILEQKHLFFGHCLLEFLVSQHRHLVVKAIGALALLFTQLAFRVLGQPTCARN
ncbi:hypothetical protein CTI12_AA231570 [Artemisia annua]|uniref:DUF659 domain-containing protein n=1 Tax=Artemisia annua TaxID=35608 RepID=A0A2U1NT34_ARTAN|nr:hypothetical protein CTI12_AA231570 [Artemisia annua]